MNSLFVDKSKILEVEFYVGISKKGELIASATEGGFEKAMEVTDIEKHTVKFRMPSYRDNVEILSMTMRTNGNSVELDPALLRYERFCALLTEWTLTENGEPVRATRTNVDRLSPQVANVIMDRFDEVLDEVE